MNEMLLLGAGASREAGVPIAYEMTERIAQEFEHHHQRYFPAVSFILGGLLFQNGIRGLNPLKFRVNVEEFFNAVQMLASRTTLEAAPFVGSWHSMVDIVDQIDPPRADSDRLFRLVYEGVVKEILDGVPRFFPGFRSRDIDDALSSEIQRAVTSLQRGGSSYRSSGRTLSKAVESFLQKTMTDWFSKLSSRRPDSWKFRQEFEKAIDQQPRPGEGKVFTEIAEIMIRTLARIVWIEEPSRVDYLSPLLVPLQNQKHLTIATLNYDNAVEQLADSHDAQCQTGITDWSNTGAFEPPSNGIFLLKLHGSIEWKLSEQQTSPQRPMPHTTLETVDVGADREEMFRPAVIFGQKNKLTADGPFLDLLRTFHRELMAADRLTIVGYSFADPHVNVFISQWLNSNATNRIRVVDPGCGSP